MVAGSSSRVAAMAGLRLPIESHVLQAFVSEGIKPLIPNVVTFGAGLKNVAALSILLLFLFIRPSGLFGSAK